MSAPQRFDVGILGAGAIVADCHLPALLASTDARVVWVADRNAKRAKMVGSSFGVRGIAAPEQIDDLPPAEIVLLAAPYGVRAPMYPALARKFGAVYVEKPFARTLEEHDRHSSFFSPERIACGYQRRSLGATRALREIVRSKMFGALERIDMGFGGPLIKTGGRYSTSLEMAGGGVLFETGVHGLDFALHIADAVATTTVSVDMIMSHGFDLHTKATLEIERREGPKVQLDLLVTTLEGASNVHVLTFADAEITFALFGENVIRVRPRNGSCSFVLNGDLTDYPRTSDQLFHEHWRSFFEAVRTGKPNATSAIRSRVTTQAVEQLYAARARS